MRDSMRPSQACMRSSAFEIINGRFLTCLLISLDCGILHVPPAIERHGEATRSQWVSQETLTHNEVDSRSVPGKTSITRRCTPGARPGPPASIVNVEKL